MAKKKTVQLGIHASFDNLGEIKKSLLDLSKLKLAPLDTVEVKKALKEVENLYKKFPNQKIELGLD